MTDTPRDHDLEPGEVVDLHRQQQVRSLLASLPEPGPMPEDLVARIQARLADEQLHGATPHPGVDELAARRRRMKRMGALAALGTAAAGIAAFGVLSTSGLHDTSTGVDALALTSSTPSFQMRISDSPVTAASLDGHVRTIVQETFSTMPPLAAESPTLGPLATPDGLRHCLATDADHVSAELTTYEGKPAVVVGLVTRGEAQAWVLDRSCSTVVPKHVVH